MHKLQDSLTHRADWMVMPEITETSSKLPTIVIVHSSRLFRDCLEQTLGTQFGNVVHFASLDQATKAIESPSIGLLLIEQPAARLNEADIERAKELVAGRVPIMVMGNCDDPKTIAGLLASGVSGYIPSSLDLDVTIRALSLVLAGGVYAPGDYLIKLWQGVSDSVEEKSSDDNFTAKQLAVVEGIRRGKPNKTIAYELNMCESTVKVHIRNIMKKLHARNRTQVAFIANQMLQKQPQC